MEKTSISIEQNHCALVFTWVINVFYKGGITVVHVLKINNTVVMLVVQCHKDHDVIIIDKGGDKSKLDGKIQRKVSSKCDCDPTTCYYKTYQYECHTCWGRDFNLRCCNFCIKNFHSNHQYSKQLVLRDLSKPFVCDCGKYKHEYNPMQSKGCSYDLLYNISYPTPCQYECHTCWGKDSNLRCCNFCIENCHNNHQYLKHAVRDEDLSKLFVCDCGKYKHKYNLTMQAKGCSYDLLNNISYPSPCRYECHTCWGKDSVYRCCIFCIKNCHSNHEYSVHKVPYKDNSKPFTCDCGKSKHKLPCCTRTSTGKENVKQPLYECYDCFKNPLEEVCCFACAKKCHAKHNVRQCSLPFESYCHCGLDCCKSLCQICTSV